MNPELDYYEISGKFMSGSSLAKAQSILKEYRRLFNPSNRKLYPLPLVSELRDAFDYYYELMTSNRFLCSRLPYKFTLTQQLLVAFCYDCLPYTMYKAAMLSIISQGEWIHRIGALLPRKQAAMYYYYHRIISHNRPWWHLVISTKPEKGPQQ